MCFWSLFVSINSLEVFLVCVVNTWRTRSAVNCVFHPCDFVGRRPEAKCFFILIRVSVGNNCRCKTVTDRRAGKYRTVLFWTFIILYRHHWKACERRRCERYFTKSIFEEHEVWSFWRKVAGPTGQASQKTTCSCQNLSDSGKRGRRLFPTLAPWSSSAFRLKLYSGPAVKTIVSWSRITQSIIDSFTSEMYRRRIYIFN